MSSLGAAFSPIWGAAPTLGQAGLGADAPPNWHEIFLDSPMAQAWGGQRGWDLKGDNPGRVSDHRYSYQHPGNSPLTRAFLAGSLGEADWRELRVWPKSLTSAPPSANDIYWTSPAREVLTQAV